MPSSFVNQHSRAISNIGRISLTILHRRVESPVKCLGIFLLVDEWLYDGFLGLDPRDLFLALPFVLHLVALDHHDARLSLGVLFDKFLARLGLRCKLARLPLIRKGLRLTA